MCIKKCYDCVLEFICVGKGEKLMSEFLKDQLKRFFITLEREAAKTLTPIDDFIVKMLRSFLGL